MIMFVQKCNIHWHYKCCFIFFPGFRQQLQIIIHKGQNTICLELVKNSIKCAGIWSSYILGSSATRFYSFYIQNDDSDFYTWVHVSWRKLKTILKQTLLVFLSHMTSRTWWFWDIYWRKYLMYLFQELRVYHSCDRKTLYIL